MIDKTPKQGSFWDTQWIEHLIDKEGFEYHFRRVVRPLIKDEDFSWAYDPERGRKAIPPSLVACALILQQRYRLSDREMEKQIRFHLGAKCRYRGLKKFDFQCFFAALAVNIQRWITLFLHAPPPLRLQMQEACG